MMAVSKRRLGILLVAAMVLLAACAKEGPLPWHDDFSDPASGWQTESDASAEVAYHEEAMRVLVKSQNCLAWAWVERELADFHLTVEAAQVAGPDDNEYGVLVRMKDADHFYCFSISGDGYYQISKFDDEGRHLLVGVDEQRKGVGGDWTLSEAIRVGTVTNTLEVVCQDSTMTFSVNGVPLDRVEDASYGRGGVGLYAGSFREPDAVEIRFDNLSITEP
jgi:hypothetical protein